MYKILGIDNRESGFSSGNTFIKCSSALNYITDSFTSYISHLVELTPKTYLMTYSLTCMFTTGQGFATRHTTGYILKVAGNVGSYLYMKWLLSS